MKKKNEKIGEEQNLAEETEVASEEMATEAPEEAVQENEDTAQEKTDYSEEEGEKNNNPEASEELDSEEEAAEPAEPTVEELYIQAMKDIKEWQDKYMRLHAEWDTYRRRMNEQRAAERVRATEGVMEGLLPVLDDFERSVKYAEENGEVGLLEGVKAVQTKLLEVLFKNGLEMIDPAGQPFDALESAAVAMVPDDSVYDETVAEVYQKGYRMGNKVLRSAMVTVATGGPRRPAPEGEEEKQD